MSQSHLTEKTLDILETIAGMRKASLPQIQQQCGLPMTTAHRIIQSLLRRGFVTRTGKASYQLGTSLLAVAGETSLKEILADAARASLAAVSRKYRSHAHLGVWEDGMVTYLVKQQYGAVRLHSAEGSQLEAYCSAIGKILLAGLPDEELNRYVAEGDFIRLTCNTIVEPHLLLEEIKLVRKRGWAVDAEEITMGLHCVAVPISDRAGKTIAAVSISNVVRNGTFEVEASLPGLMEAACEIGQRLFPH